MRAWPRSLFGRNLLLIVGLIALGQLTGGVLFYQLVQKPRIEQLASEAAGYVQTVGTILETFDAGHRQQALARFDQPGRIRIVPANVLPPLGADRLPVRTQPQVRAFVNALAEKMGAGTQIVTVGAASEFWLRTTIAGEPYWVQLQADDVDLRFGGTWLVVSLCSGLLALLGAYLIQRVINRPLHELAVTATLLGSGSHPAPLSEDVPTELAAVSRSFNVMASNLARMDKDRSVVLAGISHDLRTPLTKLRLGLAMQEPAGDSGLRAVMERQIEVMDAIIGQFIDYARDETGEVLSACDLNAMVRELAADHLVHGDVFQLGLGDVPTLWLHPVAVRRMLANLMQNAVHHAGKGLEIATGRTDADVFIAVRDRGPGVPADVLPELTRAFVRHEGSGGTHRGAGLGLAIADRIALREGGSLSLRLRDGGGLEVRITLPLPA
jgi:two-component system osmolarity sensor histidine kinase EnvZ